uniref:Uncharacterized protein n=1 Tax=Plectus sambesii TaxID=2011161 RepID=A0A914UMZ3_9BILA
MSSTLGSSGGPRKSSVVYSLHEVGVARLLFNVDYSSFQGVLINYQGESFSLHGMPHNNAISLNNDHSAQDMMNNGDDQSAGTSFDVSVVDDETGNQFLLKRILLKVNATSSSSSSPSSSSSSINNHYASGGGSASHSPPVVCELISDSLMFRTEELLVGNRADMELRTYLNPALTGSNSTVHLGKMTINVQTSVT